MVRSEQLFYSAIGMLLDVALKGPRVLIREIETKLLKIKEMLSAD